METARIVLDSAMPADDLVVLPLYMLLLVPVLALAVISLAIHLVGKIIHREDRRRQNHASPSPKARARAGGPPHPDSDLPSGEVGGAPPGFAPQGNARSGKPTEPREELQ